MLTLSPNQTSWLLRPSLGGNDEQSQALLNESSSNVRSGGTLAYPNYLAGGPFAAISDGDLSRNIQLAYAEHQMSREDMALQNAFTAEREDLAWSRQSQFAAENRAWEEKMANTSIQRAFADAKAAGINPYSIAGGAGAAVPSAQLPGYNSASSAGVAKLDLPNSKIWENTASGIKTAISSALSLMWFAAMLG